MKENRKICVRAARQWMDRAALALQDAPAGCNFVMEKPVLASRAGYVRPPRRSLRQLEAKLPLGPAHRSPFLSGVRDPAPAEAFLCRGATPLPMWSAPGLRSWIAFRQFRQGRF